MTRTNIWAPWRGVRHSFFPFVVWIRSPQRILWKVYLFYFLLSVEDVMFASLMTILLDFMYCLKSKWNSTFFICIHGMTFLGVAYVDPALDSTIRVWKVRICLVGISAVWNLFVLLCIGSLYIVALNHVIRPLVQSLMLYFWANEW